MEGFIDRLMEFAPDLEETIFAPQAYDCAMLFGLATVAAGSTNSEDIRDNIVAVTTGDNECTGFQECAEFLEDGQSISYQFASGIQAFIEEGEPLNGLYEVWQWQDGELTTVDTREISLEE